MRRIHFKEEISIDSDPPRTDNMASGDNYSPIETTTVLFEECLMLTRPEKEIKKPESNVENKASGKTQQQKRVRPKVSKLIDEVLKENTSTLQELAKR